MIRLCVVCGKEITAKFRKSYCSDICRFKAPFMPKKKRKRKRKETLCWSCDNACTGCSWSKALVPVKGWDATPIRIKYNSDVREYTDSYIVHDCPQFIPTKR
ncbi:MAG: hypothetical protein J6A69_10740 [Clostridia bacterium]|nr:hypothetical protein [Clostridia bacterium]